MIVGQNGELSKLNKGKSKQEIASDRYLLCLTSSICLG